MKFLKKGLAVLLAVLLMLPQLPAKADELNPADGVADEVSFNTGTHTFRIVEAPEVFAPVIVEDMEPSAFPDLSGSDLDVSGSDAEELENGSDAESAAGDDYFAEDGSYTINIPEDNPFFPYEVQFTCNGVVTNEWFMTPDDTVEVGGHTFRVSAYFDNTVVTSMSFDIAGQKVIVYPQEKEFTEDGGIATVSLLPLEERNLKLDLTGYDFTLLDLTMVSVESISLGAGLSVSEPDKLMWTISGDDDYSIVTIGATIDLSYEGYTSISDGGQVRQTVVMIAGDADQLAADNIRYIIKVVTNTTMQWLNPIIYKQHQDGTREEVLLESRPQTHGKMSYGDYIEIYMSVNRHDFMTDGIYDDLYIGLTSYGGLSATAANVRIFEGRYQTAEEAATGKDITDMLLTQDMTQPNAGYLVQKGRVSFSTYKYITMVAYDAEGVVTGFLPVYLLINYSGLSFMGYEDFVFISDDGIVVNPYRTVSYYYSDGWELRTYELYSEFAANATYYARLSNFVDGKEDYSDVKAYLGKYDSIAQADAAGAQDIAEQLYAMEGYPYGYAADYSQGVYFSIFVGADGSENQIVYRGGIKTITGDVSWQQSQLSNSTYLGFYNLYDANGNYVSNYPFYGDTFGSVSNYVTILVGPEVDITSLAPNFSCGRNANVYTTGGSAPEESGVTLHDFSNGPIQYTVSAENGEDSENYWLHVVKATEGTGWLYINSFWDPDAGTVRDENGIVRSSREVMLDGYQGYTHDIVIANMGSEEIPALSAELISDVVELDDYWRLNGVYGLAGFDSPYRDSSYGPSLAKLRIRAKKGVENGTDVSGILTIKSGETVLAVLTLTGTIGDPSIVTKEIPHAVKYVPYGTMIQNSNKYSWNKVTYYWVGGELPDGMMVRPNGEIYGVPLSTGEYTFTVHMENSAYEFSSDEREFTLVVDENTDENVNAQTDNGYDLTERVQNMDTDNLPAESQLMVSEGVFGEFVDLYLDGQRLTRDVDYTAESGSTRITIAAQTLTSVGTGTHTLGMEFRTEGTELLRRAAQNYTITEASENPGEEPGNDPGEGSGQTSGSGTTGEGGSGQDSSVESGESSGAVAMSSSDQAQSGPQVILYTVQSGDSLWKIAAKFYGNGSRWRKIYEDNRDVIKNPNVIYKGQVLTIILEGGQTGSSTTGSTEQKPSVTEVNADVYTVEKGDSLWKIAKKLLGSGKFWRTIYEANKDIIVGEKLIFAGQTLKIPK